MRCAARKRKQWTGLGLSLVLGLGVALPAGAADEDEGAAAAISIFEIAEQYDRYMMTSGGPVKVRVRKRGIRIYRDLDPIGHWPDPSAIPTRGASSRPVDVIYHGTRDYGQPSGIVIRAVGTVPQDDSIRTHRARDPVNGSRIRYHGGFR
ncbi:MAG: hypothetical protein ABFS46_03220 [Myxococcota bacterium]